MKQYTHTLLSDKYNISELGRECLGQVVLIIVVLYTVLCRSI